MSVVVMGMDYTEHCIECKLRYNGIHDFCIIEERDFDDEDCDAMERNDWHPDWCPLRPLPEKHGRLIDADAFKAMCRENVEDLRNSVILPHERTMVERLADATEALCLDLDEAPTIVEAEGE